MSRKSVALMGLDPFGVDFTSEDYVHLSHLGPEGLQALLERQLAALDLMGFDAELIFVPVEVEVAMAVATTILAEKRWDCILIGNGIRSIRSNFLVFEALINMIIEYAPQARVCFNTEPNDSAEAVQRWISA